MTAPIDYPENRLYLWTAGVAGLLLIAMLVLLPEDLSIEHIAFWGLLPLAGFVLLSRLIIGKMRHRPVLYAIGFIALFLRLALGIYMYTRVLEGPGFGYVFVKDDRYFFDLGVQIARHWQGLTAFPPMSRNTEVGPAYLNAFVVYLLGPDPRNVAAVQSLFGALLVPLSYSIARSLISERHSMLASFVLAIYPVQIYMAASNRRDVFIALVTLVIVLLLLRLQSKSDFRSSNSFRSMFLLFSAIPVLAFWRIYSAFVALLALCVWFLINARSADASFRRVFVGILVSSAIVVTLFQAGAISGQRLALYDRLLGAEQLGRFDEIRRAETFHFLIGARGWRRIPYLIVTLPLALVFGFSDFSQVSPEMNLNSIGYLWIWTPLLLPMLRGVLHTVRRNWKKHWLLWAVPVGTLMMNAVGYLGLQPRYRTAADPFLIVFAVLGLSQMKKGLVSTYIISILAFCTFFNILVWTPGSRVPVLVAGGVALTPGILLAAVAFLGRFPTLSS